MNDGLFHRLSGRSCVWTREPLGGKPVQTCVGSGRAIIYDNDLIRNFSRFGRLIQARKRESVPASSSRHAQV
ncbi:hypothetical protein BEQ56_05335 [Anaerolineaceae bacterium oral taxon 439]|nr:hypothetical protein BEQ56_05335 [Anaerolineaceae bacterium oral taxon 439]